jgi:hypothetical protein
VNRELEENGLLTEKNHTLFIQKMLNLNINWVENEKTWPYKDIIGIEKMD